MYLHILVLICFFSLSYELPNGVEVKLPPPKFEYSDWYDLFDIYYHLTPIIPLTRTKEKVYFIGKYFRANFLQANLFCKIMHMHLVTILSKEEHEKLSNVLQKNNVTGDYWTSATRMLDGKSWIWMSTAKPVKYKNWGPGQPNNKNDHCIIISKSNNVFTWNDRNCNCRFFFICEKPVDKAVLYISKKQESDIRKYYRTYFD